MRAFAPLLTAALLTGMAVLSFPQASIAQTSFGAPAKTVESRAEWNAAAKAAVDRALRRFGSTLAVQGNPARISIDVALVIARDRSVQEVRILRSSGRPSIDAAVQRGMSRDLGIPAFSGDMTENAVPYLMSLGTVRQ